MDLKNKIIHESMRLFSLKGFLSTSIEDILKAAGTSKGGLYNHFKSKEELFFAVLAEARRLWREKNLHGLEGIRPPVEKVKRILENYRDRYLKDVQDFPGGCIFVALSVELDDQRPRLSEALNQGFSGFKGMLKRLLDEAKACGDLRDGVDTQAVTEMIFAGMMGTSVIFGTEKSIPTLDRSIDTLIRYLEGLKGG